MNAKINKCWLMIGLAAVFVFGSSSILLCQPGGGAALPTVEFQDTPITAGIDSLSRLAGINCMVDPKIFSGKAEPAVTLHWKNMAATAALERLLKEHGLFMAKNPETGVTRISNTDLPPRHFDKEFIRFETDAGIPVIRFDDEPIGNVLKQLAGAARLKVQLDPKLSTSDATVSIRWENLTSKQALAAICENHNLNITRIEPNNGFRISPH